MMGARDKLDWLALLFHKQTIVRTEPRAVLRIRAWIVGEPAETDITADRTQITSWWMNNIKHFLWVRL
jgi:hypothetical protein